MANNHIHATLPVVLLICLAVLATSAGCLKDSAVAVTGITVGADKVTGAEVTLNVTTEVQNTYGVSSGISRVQLKAYDTTSGLVVAEQTGDAGFLGIRGSGSATQTLSSRGPAPTALSARSLRTASARDRERRPCTTSSG